MTLASGDGLEVDAIDWVARDSRDIDRDGRLSIVAVAKLADVVFSPRPKITVSVDGKGVGESSCDSLVIRKVGLEADTLHWVTGEDGKIYWNIRIRASVIVAELTRTVKPPYPKVSVDVNSKRMTTASGDDLEA